MSRIYKLMLEPSYTEQENSLVAQLFEYCVGAELRFSFHVDKYYICEVYGTDYMLDEMETILELIPVFTRNSPDELYLE